MSPAVNLVVRSVTDTGAVQRLGAEDTPEAVAVIVTAGSHHLLCGEHFPPAPGAGSQGAVARDGGRVQRHRLGLGFLPVTNLVAVETVDVIRAIGEISGVKLVFALSTGETFLREGSTRETRESRSQHFSFCFNFPFSPFNPPCLMETTRLGHHLLSLEDLALTPGTHVLLSLLALTINNNSKYFLIKN